MAGEKVGEVMKRERRNASGIENIQPQLLSTKIYTLRQVHPSW